MLYWACQSFLISITYTKNIRYFLKIVKRNLESNGLQVNIAILLKKLLKENHITSILVESGPRVSASFLSEGLVDKICWFIAPIMIGGHEAKGPLASIGISDLSRVPCFKIPYVQQLGNDLFVEAYPEKVNEKLCLQE